jgi:Icc-related predicted phosphoesterase
MKIKLISDLHHEYWKDYTYYIEKISNDDVDVLVLAGDIASKHILAGVLKKYCERFHQVVYVAGNHCHWDNSVEGLVDLLSEVKNSNFHWLYNSSWQYQNQIFHGTTLWFDELTEETIKKTGVRTSKYKAGTMYWPDFELVQGGSRVIYEEFRKAKKYLSENVKEGDIVVTHHMPSYKCVSKTYTGDPYNPFFVGDVEEVIVNNKPKLWAYGHTHQANDFMINNTRLVCNPRGYPKEDNQRRGLFNPDLVIGV